MALLLVLLSGACSVGGGSSTTTTRGPETTTTSAPTSTTRVPALTDQQEVDLEARAVARAFDGPRLCMAEADVSAELRAALAPLYEEILYVEVVDAVPDVGWDRCTLVNPLPARQLAAGVVGVDVWITYAVMNGHADTYLFRWDGTAWVDTTPEETGVTVTTAVS
jgi:hypothetical protein